MKDFITIATFTYPNDYAILRLLLEKEGISFFFENETMISVFPFYSNAVGGIHLKIHKKDKTRVQQIIDDLETNSHLTII